MKAFIKTLLRPVSRLGMKSRAVLGLGGSETGAAAWTAALAEEFIEGPCGAEYGVTAGEKRALVEAFVRNCREIQSGTAASVHIALARAILSIPPEVDGDVVECGVWKGASSASLSLVCARVGRRLKVCDSFEGLPDDGGQVHTGVHTGVYGYYQAGMFCGGQEEVRSNIERYGAIEVCDFVPGFFSESLGALSGPVAFAFLDVDLAGSTRDCLRALWPLMPDGAYLYSDDAGDLEVVGVYFDTAWWRETLGCEAPGFVGSGCGLPLSPTHSSLGYAMKAGAFDPEKWKRAPFLHYPA